MPELQAPRQPQHVDLEREPFLFEGQDIEDAAAVSLVKTTFGKYEAWRKNSHEPRWAVNERLYFGTVEKRKWPGTDVERASLGIPITYDQVESLLPLMSSALFTPAPTFFDVAPVGETHPREARKQRDIIASYLDTPYDETGLTTVPHLEMALRQGIIYGDSVIEVSWDGETKQPVVEWVDLKDFFVDPSANGPWAEASPAVIRRKMLTVEQLKNLRGSDENIKIPDDETLNGMAKSKVYSTADLSKAQAAALRQEQYHWSEQRADPRHQTIEVLIYWAKDRLIWTLNRVWAAINTENPYGFIPYCKAPFTLVTGRPYSMGLPDVLEGDQKYIQGITNARLDNLALSTRPPRKRTSGTPTTPSQTAWRPGLEEQVSKIDDVDVYKVENYTADSYREVQLAEARAAKRTGVNDFVQSGVPTPSNMNRSATGSMQPMRATSQRSSTAVKNFEDFLIVPMLYKVQKLIERFAPDQIQVASPEGEQLTAPKQLFGQRVKFKMLAASKMIVRERLAMLIGPVSQLLFNDAVANQAKIQGRTIDFAEWERFLQDATNTTKSYRFYRPMSPQEQQQAQQPDPKMMAEMQKAQLEAQTRLQMGKMKSDTEKETTKMETGAKEAETGEKSAREVLKLISAERGEKDESGKSD